MKKGYIFTFGYGHNDLKGNRLANTGVFVPLEDYGKARKAFRKYAKDLTGNPDKWAFQYKIEEYNGSQIIISDIPKNYLHD